MKRVLWPGRKKVANSLCLWPYVFSCALLLSQSLWWTYEQLRGRDMPLPIWMGIAALGSFLLAIPLSKLLCGCLDSQRLKGIFASREAVRKIPYLWLWMLCFVLWIPTFLAYYPGIHAYDFYSQYAQYFAQQFSTHHPLVHTWFMGKILEIGISLFGLNNRAAAFYIVVQMLLASAAIGYVVYELQSFRLPKWLWLLAACFFFLLPMTPVMMISATKDVLFVCAFLVGLMKLIPLCEGPFRWKQAIASAVFLTLSLLLRHNAIVGLLLTIAVLLILTGFRKELCRKWTLLFLAVILAGVSVDFGLEHLLQAQKGSNAELLSVPAQQLSYVSINREDALTEEDNAKLSWYGINKAYHPWIADDVKNNMSIGNFNAEPVAFFKFWLSVGMRFPGDYLHVFLTQTEPLWYFEREPIWMAKECYLEFGNQPDEFPLESKFARLLILDRILFGADALILKIPVLSLLHHPAFYFWLLLGILAALLHTKQYAYLVLPLLPLGYLVTLFLGPCILPRYCLPGFYAAPVILLVCLSAIAKEKQ